MITVAGILSVRRKEVQRHVAPIVAFLRIALEYRHQLDHSHAEIFQIRDLVDQTGIRPLPRRIYTRVGVLGETPEVEFVNDRIGLMTWWFGISPIKLRPVAHQRPERRPSRIRSFP